MVNFVGSYDHIPCAVLIRSGSPMPNLPTNCSIRCREVWGFPQATRYKIMLRNLIAAHPEMRAKFAQSEMGSKFA